MSSFCDEEAMRRYERGKRGGGGVVVVMMKKEGLEEMEEVVRELRVFLKRMDPQGDFMRNGYLQEAMNKVRE